MQKQIISLSLFNPKLSFQIKLLVEKEIETDPQKTRVKDLSEMPQLKLFPFNQPVFFSQFGLKSDLTLEDLF